MGLACSFIMTPYDFYTDMILIPKIDLVKVAPKLTILIPIRSINLKELYMPYKTSLNNRKKQLQLIIDIFKKFRFLKISFLLASLWLRRVTKHVAKVTCCITNLNFQIIKQQNSKS